jgi:hypothetical protein
MIRFSAFSHYEWDVTPRASVSLFLVQHPPLFLVGFPSHVLLLALRPVLAQGWVRGGIPPCALGEAGERGYVGLHQFRLSFPECPITVVPNRAGFHPLPAFVRVAAFRPRPEHRPLGMSNLLQDVFGRTVPVIIRPSPYDRVACLDDMPCRGVLMGVQVGSRRSHVLEDFFLVWDGQPVALFPNFPDVKPQAVNPCCDMHDPGCGCTECPSACLKELCYSWSGIGFQYFPCRGRGHNVIGRAYDGSPCVVPFATGWGCGASISIFCVEQPFHPIQCHMCQQWGKHAPLWRASVRRRAEAHCDDSCFQPLAQCGGADGQVGQQWFLVNGIKRSITLIPLSITQPSSQRRSRSTSKSPTLPTHSVGVVSRCVPPLSNGRRRIMCSSLIRSVWSSAFRAP